MKKIIGVLIAIICTFAMAIAINQIIPSNSYNLLDNVEALAFDESPSPGGIGNSSIETTTVKEEHTVSDKQTIKVVLRNLSDKKRMKIAVTEEPGSTHIYTLTKTECNYSSTNVCNTEEEEVTIDKID